MNKESNNSNMLEASTKLSSWQAVLEFLSAPRFNREQPNAVSIFKNKDSWTVETNSSSTKREDIKLTTKAQGVGLFDLNW